MAQIRPICFFPRSCKLRFKIAGFFFARTEKPLHLVTDPTCTHSLSTDRTPPIFQDASQPLPLYCPRPPPRAQRGEPPRVLQRELVVSDLWDFSSAASLLSPCGWVSAEVSKFAHALSPARPPTLLLRPSKNPHLPWLRANFWGAKLQGFLRLCSARRVGTRPDHAPSRRPRSIAFHSF